MIYWISDYFRQFDIVLNALDNKAARNHVNRMCLAADVPLIESGTAGYLGQVCIVFGVWSPGDHSPRQQLPYDTMLLSQVFHLGLPFCFWTKK